MKYAFMGKRDVPDWLQAEVATLSRITCVRLKLICKQVVMELLGGAIDFPKVQKFLPKDKGFSLGDIKAAVGSINFILTNAARHTVGDRALNEELQQLGLPRENADGISRPYRANAPALHKALAQRTLSLPRLSALQWRVDYTAASSRLGEAGTPSVHLKVCTTHSLHDTQPRLTSEQLGVTARLAGAGGVQEEATPSAAGPAAALLRRMDAARAALSPIGTPSTVLVEEEEGVRGGSGQTFAFAATPAKLLSLLGELRAAQELMVAVRPEGGEQ